MCEEPRKSQSFDVRAQFENGYGSDKLYIVRVEEGAKYQDEGFDMQVEELSRFSHHRVHD
jgi:hypothetical protein